eukprot:gene23626-31992_t
MSQLSSISILATGIVFGVAVTFNTLDSKQTFLKEFGEYAKYVKNYEPTTISYEALESDKDDKRILILERYATKDAFLNIHRKSAQFISFRKKLSDMTDRKEATIEGDSYIETGLGYV